MEFNSGFKGLRTAKPFTAGKIQNTHNLVFYTWVGSRLRLLLVKRRNSKTWGTNTLASSDRHQQPTALFPFRVPHRHVRVSVEILQQGRSWLLVQLLSNFHSRLVFSLYMGLYIYRLHLPIFLGGSDLSFVVRQRLNCQSGWMEGDEERERWKREKKGKIK